jgi:hypothetical protein
VTKMMIELELVGNPDDLMAFEEQLEEAGGDLALLIYRAAFDAWGASVFGKEGEMVREFAGPATFVELPIEPFDLEESDDNVLLTLKLDHPRSLLQEVICLGALFDFEVNATFEDPSGRRQRTDLRLAGQF